MGAKFISETAKVIRTLLAIVLFGAIMYSPMTPDQAYGVLKTMAGAVFTFIAIEAIDYFWGNDAIRK